jgi:hypothetical protein
MFNYEIDHAALDDDDVIIEDTVLADWLNGLKDEPCPCGFVHDNVDDDDNENYRLETEDDARQAALDTHDELTLGTRVAFGDGYDDNGFFVGYPHDGIIDMIGDRQRKPGSVHVTCDCGCERWFIGNQTYELVVV